MASKVVVLGSVNGKFPAVFSKLGALHAKNAFAFAMVAGDLFADPGTATDEDEQNIEKLLRNEIEVPLPVYFGLRHRALPKKIVEKLETSDQEEVCPNLYFLGKRRAFKTSEGIRIVALGGALDSNITVNNSKDKYGPFYCEGDTNVLHGAHRADILITSEWPKNIRTGSNVEFNPTVEIPTSQQCIADLCSFLKPRYHFSTTPDAFFEREPFFHVSPEEDQPTYPITRFISLASFENPNKAKWIYAFTLDPSAAPALSVPTGTTAAPFSFAGKKRPLDDQNKEYRRFVTHGTHHDHSDRHGRRNKRHKHGPVSQSECFFCLSNENLATHLVASIGKEAYLAGAKGPLTTSDTFKDLGFPAHILLIAMSHTPSLQSIRDRDVRIETYQEMQKYRKAMQRMLADRCKGRLGAVTWEISRASGVHIHWQFLPIAADMVRRGLVETAFQVEAQNEKFPLLQKREIGDGTDEVGDYFRVWIWSPLQGQNPEANNSSSSSDPPEIETSLILSLDTSFRFNLQFGRIVMAKLLELEKRSHWQDCSQSVEEETANIDAFKAAFEAYDFSLED